MREFNNAAELIANYKQVRARMNALKPPTRAPAPAPALIPAPTPIYSTAKITRGLILYAIVRTIEKSYGVEHGALADSVRTARIVEPRQLAYYLLKEIGEASAPKIGQILKRDHTTILHGINRTQERMRKDEAFAARVATISEQIRCRSA
jgi:DnaA-like protein